MHELSIAVNIVEIAEEKAKAENAQVIKEIELEVGELSGVVFDALDFALNSAIKDSMLESVVIKIYKIPGQAQCKQCMHQYNTDDYFSTCPQCGDFQTEIIKGKELRVKSIIIE